ncbi:MAG: extracellular solute-binding protein [Chloroflexi bacterium]|nr:extracellular solute-binding protein [Chloroflexota bacterium]
MTRKLLCLAMLFVLAALLACAPKPAAEPPAPAPRPAAPATTLPAAPSQSPEDAAWSKVVEAAKKEGKVTVYGYTFISDLNPAVTDAFYKKYGIRADIITGPGSMNSERLRTEARMKNVVADVGEYAPTFATVLSQEGLVTQMGKELPVLREDVWLAPPSMDNGGSTIRGYPSLQSPWINYDIVKAEDAPKSWSDLLNPRWGGKMLIIDPRTATSADRYVYTLTKYKIVEPDFFTKLTGQKLMIPAGVGTRPPWTALAKGEGSIIVTGADSQGSPVVAEGGHIRPIVLGGSVLATSSAFQLIKNAPHPNAGKLFIDFALSQQGYGMVVNANLLASFRKDVPDRSVMASLQPFKVFANTIEEEAQIAKNMREGVAAKALAIQ